MSKPRIPVKAGLKIAYQAPPEPTQDDINFIRRMGIEYVVLWTRAEKASAEYYASRKALYGQYSINVYGFGDTDVHNQDAIVLGLPNRDAKIEEYKQHIRNLGAAGIPYTTYAHMANGIWSSEAESTRGGARARAFDLSQAQTGHWAGEKYSMPLTHGRTYTEDEIWANYTYFIKQVVPVAEEAGVRIGIHPDDPPVPELGGIPRCIFSSFEGYKRALDIADSPNVGMCLCVGCWLEGGDSMGKDVLETIHYFGGLGKLFKVHLRNIDQPLPHFVETFLDNGYYDLYKVVKALREVEFSGVLIPDHIPLMDDDRRVGSAYSIGYMKALVERANQEVGR
ncbi:MAG: mannonate dehydratase [Anaerolineae bacterium]|nr:mannonate dehydratase [Anaerolineae bacterium]